jgi:hypothetical protein
MVEAAADANTIVTLRNGTMSEIIGLPNATVTPPSGMIVTLDPHLATTAEVVESSGTETMPGANGIANTDAHAVVALHHGMNASAIDLENETETFTAGDLTLYFSGVSSFRSIKRCSFGSGRTERPDARLVGRKPNGGVSFQYHHFLPNPSRGSTFHPYCFHIGDSLVHGDWILLVFACTA